MMTLSTSCVFSRSFYRTIQCIRHSRHIRICLLTIIAALLLCGARASFAKPYHTAQTGGGIEGWRLSHSSASLLNSDQAEGKFDGYVLPKTLHLAMVAQQSMPVAVSEASDLGAPGESQNRGSWCNNVRLQDEIVLINSRSAGSCCDPEILRNCLRSERYIVGDSCCGQWQDTDLMETLSAHNPSIPTVVYVHGNRVSAWKAKQRCLKVYRRMVCCADSERPIRFVAFSWPSAQIPGLLRDARVKAARTRPAGCQMAWMLDQIPGDVPLGLIGYSFGARVVTGALHILGGGHLNGMCLAERVNPNRQPVRVVMIAAATHAHWLGQGQYHGHALSQVDQALSINNNSDMGMQWYHLSTPNGKPQAMGLCGPTCLGSERYKVRVRNVARYVGAEHDFHRYLSSPGTACNLWKIAAWGE